MANRFQVKNRDSLDRQREAFPLAQHLLTLLGSGSGVRRFTLFGGDREGSSGWILFKNAHGGGIGIDRSDYARGLSPLQRKLDMVRSAHTVIESFGGPVASDLELSFNESPPQEWPIFHVDGAITSIRCAIGAPMPSIKTAPTVPTREPVVGVRALAELSGPLDVTEPGVVGFKSLIFMLPELGVRALCQSMGGDMELSVKPREEVGEQIVSGVRLDLGEVQVRLCDLVGLRPGVVMNLGAVTLERCFLRLGSTVLAEGVFSSRGGELLVTIESVA